MNDQLPGPELDHRLRFMGLPLSYGGLPQLSIPAPRLTDNSRKGTYNAIIQAPHRAVDVLNNVSTRIGAPALFSDTGVKAVMDGGGYTPEAGPVRRRIPEQVSRYWAAAQVKYRWVFGPIGAMTWGWKRVRQ